MARTLLYERCPVCNQPGSDKPLACRFCDSKGYVETGLTSSQIDMYLRRHDELRAALASLVEQADAPEGIDEAHPRFEAARALLKKYPPAKG